MKTKMLFVMCTLLCTLLSTNSYAQIQIDSSEVYDNELIIIGNANFGRIFPGIGPDQELYCRIGKEGTIYGIRLRGYRSGIETKEGNFVTNTQFKEKYTIFLALGRSIQETKQSIETISNLIKNTTTEKITQFKDVEGRDIELSIKNGYADAKVNGFSVGITFDKHTIKRMLNNLSKKAEKKVAEALAKMKAKHN